MAKLRTPYGTATIEAGDIRSANKNLEETLNMFAGRIRQDMALAYFPSRDNEMAQRLADYLGEGWEAVLDPMNTEDDGTNLIY